MKKKLLLILTFLSFVTLFSGCVIVHTEKPSHFSVTIINNSSSNIIVWYLEDVKTNDKYGRDDELSKVFYGDIDSLQFESYKNYKCYISFGPINKYFSKSFYLDKDIIIEITGTQIDPKYVIYKEFSRSAADSNNKEIEFATIK
mgnify:CR=1 FL=1